MKQIFDKEEIRRCLAESDFESCFSFSIKEDVRLYFADKGDNILKEGEKSDGFLYYMVSGRAKLFCSLSNGKTSLLDFLHKDSFIGELELLSVRKTTMGVKALSPCFLLAMPIEKYRSRLLSDACFLQILCMTLAKKEEKRIHAISSTQGFPLANRLAHFVLFAAIDGSYTELNTDASAYLGVSYRHLTQVLGEFTQYGYLKRVQGGYIITNEQALKLLADELNVE
ncbi:transcriptional regulator YeiL [Tissierella creatinophila]|uniref:Regulatory protein YeiL n=1 Tax=Tissierella creatinophila DSM 6911 TaxID=1123403 RepID=A0A1U7M3W8_TISCR|nr:transcriptional regulator YeiL [Tissierella creatinophila]OLS01909.1 regulatory protein YeiL [Tissierella creatinophila DSM 6911]